MLCARCHYDLRSHTEDQCCPECGLPVQETIAMRRRGKSQTAIGLFMLLSLFAGCACWFLIFGVAWSGAIRIFFGTLGVAGILPAFLAGAIGRQVLGEDLPRMLATCYSWPMAGWGVGAVFSIPSEGWSMLYWTAAGGAMFGAAVLGTFVADWLHRRLTSS